MDKFYSVEEVSKILQVHDNTTRRYIKSGRLKAVKMDRAYRISETDLKAFLDSLTPQGEK